jgi:hypothetical protein
MKGDLIKVQKRTWSIRPIVMRKYGKGRPSEQNSGTVELSQTEKRAGRESDVLGDCKKVGTSCLKSGMGHEEGQRCMTSQSISGFSSPWHC